METPKTAPPSSTEVAKVSGGGAALVQIRNLEDLIKFSEFLSKSNLVPKQYVGRPNDIAVCLLHGHEVGLSHMASLQSIAVINGNPGMYGDAPLAIVRASGHLEWIKEEWNEETKTATCKIKRLNDPTVYEGSFSLADAQRIGLANKDSYKNYGKRMCQFRARSFPLRDAFGDVLKGMRQAEELEEFIETTAEHVSSETIPMPKRTSGNGDGKAAAPKEPDPADQRTPETEHPETQSQEPPPDEATKPAGEGTDLKAKIEEWIDGSPDEEILKSSASDRLFEMMKPFPDSDPQRSQLANRFIKRKKGLWKASQQKQGDLA